MSFSGNTFTVRAPASSANLGPGFDAIGLALDLWNESVVDPHGTSGEVTDDGPEAALLAGRKNMTLTAMQSLANEFHQELPPFALRCHTRIPVARGLGSSAAALASGLVAANHLLDLGLTDDELFARAWEAEGHGDNVGAAMHGGAVLAVPGIHRAIPLWDEGDAGFTCVVFIPEATGATWAARAALPALIPHPDAAMNLAHAAGLTLGLRLRDRELIAAGMHDRLHEPYRARLFPHLDAMKDAALAHGAIGAALSGAGPTVIALTPPERVDAIVAAFTETAGRISVIGTARELAPIATGVRLCQTASIGAP